MQPPTPLDMEASTSVAEAKTTGTPCLYPVKNSACAQSLYFLFSFTLDNCCVYLSNPKLVLRLKFVHEAALSFSGVCNCLNGCFLRSIPAVRKKAQKGFGQNLPIGSNLKSWPLRLCFTKVRFSHQSCQSAAWRLNQNLISTEL